VGRELANPTAPTVTACPTLKKKWANGQKKWAETKFLIFSIF
jgi:hypothetical protein